MRLRYTPEAACELEQILAFIAEHSQQGAARVQARIQQVVAMLIEDPRSGRLTNFRSVRLIVLRRHPYIVLYQVRGDELVVIGIRHAARKPAAPRTLL